jgi:hypothetical protein
MSFEPNDTTEAHEYRIVRCKSCNARIVFLETAAGKRMPINADTVEAEDMFQSKAICPECEPKWRKGIAKYGEEHLIRGYCPQFMTFHAWVMQLRGGDNSIKVYSL